VKETNAAQFTHTQNHTLRGKSSMYKQSIMIAAATLTLLTILLHGGCTGGTATQDTKQGKAWD